jgi:hypothetical protein
MSQDISKIISKMITQKDCAHCDDLDKFYVDSKDGLTVPIEYNSIDVESDEGKEFAKTNDVSGTPISKICTVNSEGKQDCQTFVGVDDAKAYVNKFRKAELKV